MPIFARFKDIRNVAEKLLPRKKFSELKKRGGIFGRGKNRIAGVRIIRSTRDYKKVLSVILKEAIKGKYRITPRRLSAIRRKTVGKISLAKSTLKKIVEADQKTSTPKKAQPTSTRTRRSIKYSTDVSRMREERLHVRNSEGATPEQHSSQSARSAPRVPLYGSSPHDTSTPRSPHPPPMSN